MKDPAELRKGFTTGTCVATCARIAYRVLKNGVEEVDSESVLFPDGLRREIAVESVEYSDNKASAQVIKDAGDDPDVTDKARISAKVSIDGTYTPDPRDHNFRLENATVIVTVDSGIGVATRDGLDVAKGKWAINPGPIRMITDNLKEVGCGLEKETVVVSVKVKDGETIAKKTLNFTLGIEAGISILGTSGIVEPYSNAAYRDTVKIHLRYASLKNSESTTSDDVVCICTGGRTKQALERDYHEIPDYSFIRIGDFIADTLKFAAEFEFEKVIIGCMPGKLFKYSRGFEYTHAHNVKLDTKELLPTLAECGVAEAVQQECVACPTVREALSLIPDAKRKEVFDHLGRKALKHFYSWTSAAPSLKCEIRCYSFDTSLIGSWK